MGGVGGTPLTGPPPEGRQEGVLTLQLRAGSAESGGTPSQKASARMKCRISQVTHTPCPRAGGLGTKGGLGRSHVGGARGRGHTDQSKPGCSLSLHRTLRKRHQGVSVLSHELLVAVFLIRILGGSFYLREIAGLLQCPGPCQVPQLAGGLWRPQDGKPLLSGAHWGRIQLPLPSPGPNPGMLASWKLLLETPLPELPCSRGDRDARSAGGTWGAVPPASPLGPPLPCRSGDPEL